MMMKKSVLLLICVLALSACTITPVQPSIGSLIVAAEKKEELSKQLVEAVKNNDIEQARSLIKQGAYVNFRYGNRNVPLHAVKSINMTNLLIEKGGDPNIQDNDKDNALDNAHLKGNIEVAAHLKKKGVTGQNINDLLVRTIKANLTNNTLGLLKSGADANVRNHGGETPLMVLAFHHDNPEIAKILIDHGADIEAKDNSNDTPVIEAAWGGRPNLTKLLIEKGAKVNAQSANGKTPLHWASENLPNGSPSITAEGRLAVVQILLENKANVNAKDSQGYTPLDLATKSEKSDIASLLKKHGGKHSDTFKKEKIAQQKAEKERIKQEQQKEQQKQKKLARLAKCEHVYVGQRKWLLETAFLIVPVTVLYEVVGVSSKAGKATVKYIDGPHRHSRYGMRKEVSCTEIPE
ncbi:MAG: ankyrin repeat domain-containing protein [Neisseriaceae bacterium]|nr:ankyrin repeat domain-containing protein [Neisseriaceae bacterium]